MSHSPEHQPRGAEHSGEIARAAAERAEALRSPEASVETSHDRHEKVAAAHHEAKKEALFAAEAAPAEKHHAPSPSAPRLTSKDVARTYQQTMAHVRAHMSKPAQAFSKIIHQPTVEKVSDSVGGSVARPNAIVAGSLTALVTISIVYLIARHYGYQLSGFETIGAFVIGWVVGLIYDYARVGLAKKS